ncbi:MAG: hypothetical protein N3D17_05300 [bacterium]|nr:hypothetical protein [bacterium]
MREIYEALKGLKKEVNVGIVGCGWWGICFVSALKRSGFMVPRLLIDKDINKCKKAYFEFGIKKEDILYIERTEDIKKIDRYKYIVANDVNLLEDLEKFNIDIIHESTGGVISGAKTALFSIENKIPFTTINSEMDATIGLILSKKALEKGIIYTNTEGDQPGCLAEMIDTVISWGFEPRIVGNCKLFLDHYQTPEGVMPWVPEGGNPYSYSGAADGSKISIELSVVANAFNFPPFKRGMYGPDTKKIDIVKTFHNLIDLDTLSGGHIDYTFGSTEPDMGGPVFVIGYTQNERLKAEMKNYKKGIGPYYLFFRDHHLGSIEAPLTIAKALFFNSPFLSPKVWCSEVITVAKRDLKAGIKLDEIGGYDYYGLVEKADISFREKMLPLGLASFATLKRDVKKDDIITYDDVELEDNLAVKLRKEQDLYWFGKN